MPQASIASDKARAAIVQIIKTHMAVLGPGITLWKANAVSGLRVNQDGEVALTGDDPDSILRALIDGYVALVGPVARNTIDPILKRENISLNKF